MQLTIFASITLLCSSVLAAPPLRRGGGSDPSLIGVGIDVTDIANNLTVKVLSTRDSSVDLGSVLRARGGSSDGTLIGVDVDVNNLLNNATVKVLST